MSEQKGLKVSTAGILVIGPVGIVIAELSRSRAIMLDGVFKLVYFVAGLFTLIFTIDRRWGAPVESLA